jgi:hypothetical protein
MSEPKTTVGVAIHHIGESSGILMPLSRSATGGRVMSTSTMGPAVLGRRIGVVIVVVLVIAMSIAVVAAVVAIAIVVLVVAVAIVIVAVVAIMVVVAVVAIAGIVVAVVLAVVVVPHHGGHHVLHLSTHGSLARLYVSFSTLETIRNISEGI